MRSRAIILSSLLSLLLVASMSLSAAPDSTKISLAVFPFNNVSKNTLDMDIPAMLHAELSGYGFIEIVPVEVIREKFYEIGPGFLWTEKDDAVKKGGILWKIEPKIVEKVNETVSADFSLYGDLTSIGDSWRVDAFLVKDGEPESVKTFKLSGVKYNELPAKLTVMSKSISDLLRGDAVLKEAEEDIRQYKGGMVSYPEVIGKVKKHMSAVPQSLPLRALLLDLYLEDRDGNREDILSEGLRIINLLKQQENSDTRYLLSLALDPFDAVAGIYEKKQDWNNAIIIREKALGLFPYNSELHREGMGRNYYFIAKSFEEKGSREKAMDNYKTAISYLQSSSDFFKQAMEGIDRLR